MSVLFPGPPGRPLSCRPAKIFQPLSTFSSKSPVPPPPGGRREEKEEKRKKKMIKRDINDG